MSTRAYGQYCGLARALEMIGERWALLLVRDLLTGPKRFNELHRGLPRIPTNILTTRLKELEQSGIVRRRQQPGGSVVYELSEYGNELEEIVRRLGLWGAQSLGDPQPEEIVTADSLMMALRTTFRPEAAQGVEVGYELRFGEIVVHARIRDGRIETGKGPLAQADLVIETGPAFRALLAGELSPGEAIASGSVHLTGPPELLELLTQLFRIPTKAVSLKAEEPHVL
ncbi:MAG: winged helix-turn-helix transcriptional regulator [Candidatus Sericytochromatia bacterium]